MQTFSEHRALEFSPKEIAGILNKCFEGYLVSFTLDEGMFERRFRPEGLDTSSSVILMNDSDPVGICLIARQGWTSRVAAMAIAPDFRSQGVGKRLMMKVIEEAKLRQDRRFLLEVIEQNAPAIGLYESVGLRQTRRLVGYLRKAEVGEPAQLTEMDPSVIVRMMINQCASDLPWDFKPETLATKPNMVGLNLESQCYALITDAAPERVVIWSLFTKIQSRRQGYGRRMVDALATRFPEKSFMTPVAVPDDLATEFVRSTGFTEFKVSQFEMAVDLQ